jgi:hypothetical protein
MSLPETKPKKVWLIKKIIKQFLEKDRNFPLNFEKKKIFPKINSQKRFKD